MKIFHYHPETGAFVGEGIADASPLEPGVWLIPAYATTVHPPEPKKGKQAVMVNGTWQVLPIPQPEPVQPPTPTPHETLADLTPAERLARAGLSVDDLRQLLGLTS